MLGIHQHVISQDIAYHTLQIPQALMLILDGYAEVAMHCAYSDLFSSIYTYGSNTFRREEVQFVFHLAQLCLCTVQGL